MDEPCTQCDGTGAADDGGPCPECEGTGSDNPMSETM